MVKGYVKFYHPDETLHYQIEKSVCKTVWQDKVNCLLIEIESTDSLDHVDEDAIQNSFPKMVLSIDDFPVKVSGIADLANSTLSIPESFAELIDEDGEAYEVYYTNLSLDEDDYETINNKLIFSQENGESILLWKGECPNFTKPDGDYIPFEAKVYLSSSGQIKT